MPSVRLVAVTEYVAGLTLGALVGAPQDVFVTPRSRVYVHDATLFVCRLTVKPTETEVPVTVGPLVMVTFGALDADAVGATSTAPPAASASANSTAAVRRPRMLRFKAILHSV